MYRLVSARAVKGDMKNIDKSVHPRIQQAIKQLAQEPRLNGCQKPKSFDGYRVRVGDYRVIYAIDDANQVIEILRVSHRKESYR